ncbi:MAG: amidohydrolase family protein [Gemmatimonadota bacterium]
MIATVLFTDIVGSTERASELGDRRWREILRAHHAAVREELRRAREQAVFPMEEAVQRMTSLPAKRVGLTDRGVLEPEAYADITVFDPGMVCDRASFEDPKRLAVGIRHVIVNGVPVLRNGEPTGALPGLGLRSGGSGGAMDGGRRDSDAEARADR